MALLTDIDDDYTRTGKGRLGRWSDRASMIPIVGGFFALTFGAIDTMLETGQYLFRGQWGSALTALISGGVGTAVNTVVGSGVGIAPVDALKNVGIKWWVGNLGSKVMTDASLGTHARAATESVIGAVTGVLGIKPQVLKSYPAAIGSINTSMAPQGPGKFASGISAQRGEDANAAYQRYVSGEGGPHLNELQSAYGRGA